MRRKLESKALRGCVVTLQFDLFQLTEKCIEANITSTGGNIAALSGALSGAVYGGCVTAGHLAQRSLSRNDAAILQLAKCKLWKWKVRFRSRADDVDQLIVIKRI